MWVARFLSGLSSSFDSALSAVFSRLRHATLLFAAPFPTDSSALAAFVGSSHPSGPYRSLDFCRGRPNCAGSVTVVEIVI